MHGVVKQHGGAVAVESAPGQGASFHVYLPVGARPAPLRYDGSAPPSAGSSAAAASAQRS